MPSQIKRVFGIGINDARLIGDQPVSSRYERTKDCPFYTAWSNMIERCYSAKYHERKPSYLGCSVTDEWIYFSNFMQWMKTQPWEGNTLDKDILHPGNKVYGPETCVFVSKKLNLFVIDSAASRGNFPLGVCYHKAMNKLRATCSNPFTGKNESLGYYTCPQDAHEAWRKRKHEHACRYADMQTDQRIAEALRKRYAKSGGQDE